MSDKNSNLYPMISVGMPVYNGEKTIRAAVDSILTQTIGDFELIISDNASTDGTEKICREFANADSRIRYIRQTENIGAPKNFRYVLDEARAEYFMWATSDDVKSIDFLEENHSFLKNNPEYVASTSPVRFEGGDFNSTAMGDASLIGELPERVQDFFVSWHANGRYCSLMRTGVLRKSPYIDADFLGADWAAMLYVISRGKTNRHTQGAVVLGRNGFSNSGNIMKYYRRKWIHGLVPFLELSKATFGMCVGFPLRCRLRIAALLIKLNLQGILASVRAVIGKSPNY